MVMDEKIFVSAPSTNMNFKPWGQTCREKLKVEPDDCIMQRPEMDAGAISVLAEKGG